MSQVLALTDVRIRADTWRLFVVIHITVAVLLPHFRGGLRVLLSKIGILACLDEARSIAKTDPGTQDQECWSGDRWHDLASGIVNERVRTLNQ